MLSLVTWSRFLIKKILSKHSNQLLYGWDKMSIHTKWTPASMLVLCFDVPATTQAKIEQEVSHHHRYDSTDMYAMHIVILNEIVQLFDESVWALRDEIRQIEKVDLKLILDPIAQKD